jgi:hypothetical protein
MGNTTINPHPSNAREIHCTNLDAIIHAAIESQPAFVAPPVPELRADVPTPEVEQPRASLKRGAIELAKATQHLLKLQRDKDKSTDLAERRALQTEIGRAQRLVDRLADVILDA